MKYTGGGGGQFVSFKTPGDKYTGTVLGVRELPNRMEAGKMQTVVDVAKADGTRIVVALGPRALQDAWKNAVAAEGGSLIGRTVTFEFEKTYKPKNGGNLGKEISVDVHSDDRGAPGTPGVVLFKSDAKTPSGDAIEAAYNKVIELRGADAAAQIRRAVENVEKDASKHAAMLLKAVGVAA